MPQGAKHLVQRIGVVAPTASSGAHSAPTASHSVGTVQVRRLLGGLRGSPSPDLLRPGLPPLRQPGTAARPRACGAAGDTRRANGTTNPRGSPTWLGCRPASHGSSRGGGGSPFWAGGVGNSTLRECPGALSPEVATGVATVHVVQCNATKEGAISTMNDDRAMLRALAQAILRVVGDEAPRRRSAAPRPPDAGEARECISCNEPFTADQPWKKLCRDCWSLQRQLREAPREDPDDLFDEDRLRG